ncbi:glycoside hydrolase family 16 [Fusarium longipes]|uniref:Glycoside hydrolase family 16 n=1 Tax=Fusarium longipes TaxID=694270 RepID=A0A395RMD4_9HYPO|nr:glycoside hydrolase family 16 [Fusarium longipes]
MFFNAASVAAEDDCSAFSIGGTHSATFQFYRFYDFRSASDSDRVLTGDPASKDRKQPDVLATSRLVSNSSWTDDWKATVKYQGQASEKSLARHYVADHVFLDKSEDETRLVLYTDRLKNDTQQAGEVYFSESLVDSISLRVYARVSGSSGAVAGFFTYFNDTQESDIEVLTRDEDDRVHFSNQPTENTTTWTTIPGSTHNESRSGSFRDWTVYRLDWLRDQGLTAWYIDGKLMKTSEMNVPVMPSTVYMNMWSNGGSFSGRMSYDSNATLEVQWIQMAFNASGVRSENGRSAKSGPVCLIDDGKAEPTSSGVKIMMEYAPWALLVVATVLIL